MKAAKALVAWTPVDYKNNPTAGQIKIGPLLREGQPDWSEAYMFSGGASESHRKTMDGWEAVAFVFIEFNTIVARDGIPVEAAHEAFLNIDEYAEYIAPDLPGARKKE